MALGSYTKTTWAERVRQYANRFTLTNVSGTTYDLARVEGTVSAVGTPLSITNLQNIEDQIYDLTEEAITPSYLTDTTVTQQITSLPSTAMKSPFKTAEVAGNTTNGYDSNTKLLLYFEGADASTTFTDQTGKTVTASGNAQIDTAYFRWGSSSGKFDGTGDYLTVTDANNDLDIGTSDFTIEFWVRFNSVSGTQTLIDFRQGGEGVAINLGITSSKLFYYVNSAIRITGSTTLVAGVWYHVALVKTGGYSKLYLNGIQDGSSYADTNNYISVTNIVIGIAYNGIEGFNGWLDELRISNTARYTTTFTPAGLNLLHSEKLRVKSVGKNLFDKNNVENGYYISNTTGALVSDVNYSATEFIRVVPSTAYYLSGATNTAISGNYNRVMYYDETKSYITYTDVIKTGGTFTTPSGCAYIRTVCKPVDYDTCLLEKGSSATTYESYTETNAIAPVTLRSVSASIQDTFDALSGLHTQNVGIDTDISSTQYDSLDTATYTNVDVVKTTAFSSMIAQTTSADGTTKYIDKNNKTLTEVAQANIDETGSVGKYYTHTDETVWIILAKGAYANIGDARTGLGTTQLLYQLATPVTTQYLQNALVAEPSGTVIVEPFVEDVGRYSSGITIDNSSYPISSLDYVYKVDIDNGHFDPVAISDCTVAGDGLSFTISGASDGDYYLYGYNYVGLSSIASLTYSYSTNLKAQVNQNTTGIVLLDEAIKLLKAEVEAQVGTIIQPNAFYSADFTQASPGENTWYTALDISGRGLLSRISAYSSDNGLDNATIASEVRVTIDGTLYTPTISNVFTRGMAERKGGYIMGNLVYDWLGQVYFKTSLKVEVRTTDSGGGDHLNASIDYSLEV